MSAFVPLSRVLAGGSDEGLFFECPGCDMPHRIQHGAGDGPRWVWNGNAEKPTFTPSILVRYPWGPEQAEQVCHSFVTDGRIQFLSDCTHALAGQTVELPDWDSV
ncbi:MAG: DUF6527 family protein [Pseudomonas sp.]|uniref:DUF6527 family protein n=1 Tax=Pseudomonas sp. TaxID=306 RepID=UPI003BB65D97